MDALRSQQVDVLNAIREADEGRREHEQRIPALVAAARECGVSWQSIGQVLRTSKQAAWERFGQNDPHSGRNQPPSTDAAYEG